MNWKEYLTEGRTFNELDSIMESFLNELNSVEKMDEVNIINEDGGIVSIPLIISILTASPAFIKMFATLGKKITSKFKSLKGVGEKIGDKLISFADKWHHLYIKAIVKILEFTKIYDKAKITEMKDKEKVAEVLFYIVIFGLAIYSGLTTANHIIAMFKDAHHVSNLNMTTLEGALTLIKSKEIKGFIGKLV